MKNKARAFVRTTVSNLRRALEKYESTSHYSEATNVMFADQYAKAVEHLELWETIARMIEEPNSKVPEGSSR